MPRGIIKRYFYESRDADYFLIDRKRGFNQPIGRVFELEDAEKLVAALNRGEESKGQPVEA